MDIISQLCPPERTLGQIIVSHDRDDNNSIVLTISIPTSHEYDLLEGRGTSLIDALEDLLENIQDMQRF